MTKFQVGFLIFAILGALVSGFFLIQTLKQVDAERVVAEQECKE